METDTRITHLRNIMTPMVNYFSLIKERNQPERKVDQIAAIERIMKIEENKAIDNMREVLEIIRSIPDDAITSHDFKTLDQARDDYYNRDKLFERK